MCGGKKDSSVTAVESVDKNGNGEGKKNKGPPPMTPKDKEQVSHFHHSKIAANSASASIDGTIRKRVR